jgi:hypothetical protein
MFGGVELHLERAFSNDTHKGELLRNVTWIYGISKFN